MVVTAATQGRRTFSSGTLLEAQRLGRMVPDALLAAESPAGDAAAGFDIALDPAALGARGDRRPLVVHDNAGMRLLANCHPSDTVYVACLRNGAATAAHLASRREDVALLAAG